MTIRTDWRQHGFVRVAAASCPVVVADVAQNTAALEAAIRSTAGSGASVIVTPELGITGYSAGDLFAQHLLLEEAWTALLGLTAALADLPYVCAVVGLPVRCTDSRIYNCAAVVSGGSVRGLVPKQFLPNRAEFYEDR